MIELTGFVLVILIASSLALPAPPPQIKSATSSSLYVEFPELSTALTQDVLAYELSVKMLLNADWSVIRADIGSEGNELLDVQIVSIRVDSDTILSGGSFELALEYNGITGEDFQALSRTLPISWNATSSEFLHSLKALGNVKIKEVRRCDEFGGNTDVGSGGFNGWLYGCPYEILGGYRWLVVFQLPARGEIPTMYQYRNHLGSTYSGAGNQVTVTHIRRGFLKPYLCHRGICGYNVTGLLEGMPYSVRTRALTESTGWTGYSKASEFVSTTSNLAPSRPRPPLFSQATTTSLFLSVASMPSTQGVGRIETQFRLAGSGSSWLMGPTIDTSTEVQRGFYTLQLGPLNASTAYESRIRAVNSVGVSPYSSASAAYSTLVDYDKATVPLPPMLAEPTDSYHPVTASYIDVVVRSNPQITSPIGTVTYALQYRPESDPKWYSVADPIVFTPRRQGVVLQSISSRIATANKATSCTGYFWLRLGVVQANFPKWSISSPIAINASANDMAQAIRSIGSVSAAGARVMVRRHANTLNGYTWQIEIQGMGDIPLLSLFKHTLQSQTIVFPKYKESSLPDTGTSYPGLNTTENYNASDINGTIITGNTGVQIKYESCWPSSPNFPVVGMLIRGGGDVFIQENVTVRIPNLQAQMGYHLRVALLSGAGLAGGTVSNETYVKTLVSGQALGGDSLGQMSPGSTPLVALPASRQDINVPLGPAFTAPGLGLAPAKQGDFHYLAGIGMGGSSGQAGEAGHCVVITYNPHDLQPFHSQRLFYNGQPQRYVVPANAAMKGDITQITFKCWGGGGGGGKITDLNIYLQNLTGVVSSLSDGGGAGFAQITIPVNPLDVFAIIVAGGGQAPAGETGGPGGYNGGGRGGDGLLGGGGGGGGGASVVIRVRKDVTGADGATGDGDVLLVAAGGAGGGSTDYCCAAGGAAGDAFSAYNGTSPTDNTPWPLSSTLNPSPVRRRFEYTSSACPDTAKADCISVWDVLPQSLPAQHLNLQYGRSPTANYSLWATGGSGATFIAGGAPGTSGSFSVRLTGDEAVLQADGNVAVFAQGKGREQHAQQGYYLRGGNGGEGKEGGGGGGGGFWGGGGGGSGIDAAGGGGGTCFVNSSMAVLAMQLQVSAALPVPVLIFVNDTTFTVNWTLNWDNSLWGVAEQYDVELSLGAYSDDFFQLETVTTTIPARSQFTRLQSTYTVANLSPSATYRVRVTPLYSKGRGMASAALTVTTLASAFNYWEPIIPRRLSLVATGRGFSDPVLDRPHLSTGVEVFGAQTKEDPLWFSDAPTRDAPVLPSGRRGQSLSTIDGNVYMFGGRTDGYTCASIYKDLLFLGEEDAGLHLDPCQHFQGEVNELWSMDVHTYQWSFINSTVWGSQPPPPREQHVAAVVGEDLYVFGGKTRIFPANYALRHTNTFNDHVYGDMWRLHVQHAHQVDVAWSRISDSYYSAPAIIPQDRRLFLPINGTNAMADPAVSSKLDPGATLGNGVSSRYGMCVDKVTVTVVLTHQCMNQLRLSLMGPGPQTGSPNFHTPSASHEVLLFNQPKTNGTGGCVSGRQTLTFDDDSTRLSSQCCSSSYSGSYKPGGPLAEFIGAPPSAEWTLVAQDMQSDGLGGSIISWEVSFVLSPCVRTYIWEQINSPSGAVVAPARYQAHAVALDIAIFIFGGRSNSDTALSDLYRFNTVSRVWTALTPVNFDIALETSSAVGANFLMTSFGLLRYGGYFRFNQMTREGQSYTSDVFLQDPVTLRWKQVAVEAWPFRDSKVGAVAPQIRYLSAAAFIPTSQLSWHHSFSYRGLYDQPIPSTYSNYIGALADSVLIIGGHDGTENDYVKNDPLNPFGGSSGGFLTDMWMLRLSNWSTAGARQSQQHYLDQSCKWRGAADSTTCMGSSGAVCEVRSLFLLAWCSQNNQTIA